MKQFKLPPDLLLGAGSSAFQIDGKKAPSTWEQWTNNLDKQDLLDKSLRCDHRKHVDDDIKILKRLHQKIYYMSVDWALIEPEEGQLSERVVRKYRDEIIKLNKQGIQVLLTLFHHNNPVWFEQKGGWLSNKAATYFELFTKHVVHVLGDVQQEWITFHDPSRYLNNVYLKGIWPGARQETQTGLKDYHLAAKHMIEAHIRSYLMIHNIRKLMARENTKVSASININLLDVTEQSWLNTQALKRYTNMTRDIFLAGMIEGNLIRPLGREKRENIARYCDFLAVTYSGRVSVVFENDKSAHYARPQLRPGVPVDDVEQEIHPEGMFEMIQSLFKRYYLPVYITANGVADAGDEFRARFMYDHLQQVTRLVAEGVDVQRYYYWSLFDSMEWEHKYDAHYGIIRIRKESRREIKKSGRFYSDICRFREVNKAMIAKYLTRQKK